MRILVTGASGRAGWVTLQHLVREGFDCIGTDLSLPTSKICPFIVANLTHREIAYSLLEGVDAIVHFGNIPSLGHGNPQNIYSENITINGNLFQAAHETGIQKIIFASSIQVMGSGNPYSNHTPFEGGYLPLDGNSPADPRNLYALSKANTEELLKLFVKLGLPSAIAIRFPFLLFKKPGYAARNLMKASDSRVREAFSLLQGDDVATLVAACLRTELPGYRCYFPSCREFMADEGIEVLRQKYFSHLELRKDLNTIGSFVDISEITRDTGWEPTEINIESHD